MFVIRSSVDDTRTAEEKQDRSGNLERMALNLLQEQKEMWLKGDQVAMIIKHVLPEKVTSLSKENVPDFERDQQTFCVGCCPADSVSAGRVRKGWSPTGSFQLCVELNFVSSRVVFAVLLPCRWTLLEH